MNYRTHIQVPTFLLVPAIDAMKGMLYCMGCTVAGVIFISSCRMDAGFLSFSTMSSEFFSSSCGIAGGFLCGMAAVMADGFLCGIADGLDDSLLFGFAAGLLSFWESSCSKLIPLRT